MYETRWKFAFYHPQDILKVSSKNNNPNRSYTHFCKKNTESQDNNIN